ncbi:MAG: hypothetical protein KDA30_12240, partial [Phycisphaerales bacterium]|nr:hypothetical protein [Phycisphaerales bacterium]
MGTSAERCVTVRGAWMLAVVAGTVMGVPGWMVGDGSVFGARAAMGQSEQPPEDDPGQYSD